MRKTFFELNFVWLTRENLEDSVVNLMCLFVEKFDINDDYFSVVVKVRYTCELFYFLLFLVRFMCNFL